MAKKTSARVKNYRRVEYTCKLCQGKNFGDPAEMPLSNDRGFVMWLSSVAAHVIVHHPQEVGTVPMNRLLVASYS